MDLMSSGLLMWIGLVFVLGLRHGLDGDHLAIIDGLSRYHLDGNPRLARWTGTLFSLGHGMVVIAVSAFMSGMTNTFEIPGWFKMLGTWTSITFLTVLALMNLINLLQAGEGEMVRPAGLKGRFLGKATQFRRPGVIVLVGALFALAFDTLSQVAAWTLAASTGEGWPVGILLGSVFMAGMMLSDGLNGFWMASLLRRADARACRVSRMLSAAIIGLSFGMASYEAGVYFRPNLDDLGGDRAWMLSAALLILPPIVYVLALGRTHVRSRTH